ncbi:RloB family protein [Veillonella atypica]|uniref:RloB domain-containing protein n=1 Tax=Veillonella atypica TaxID=39777 RepID=UPI001D05EE16|nr:RloB domain-containing protein [Veillonella atypica]MCB6770796.1 RloB family protein [Veillonella atypica]
MVPLLPPLKDNKKIYIICEGSEEYDYLNWLKLLNVWSDVYDITLRDAKGNGNLYPIYQNVYQKGNYDLVVIVCDTEKKPHEQFNDICCKVNSLHACELASQHVVMFTNPCTMQVILLHWDTSVRLQTPSKRRSATYIEKYTGIQDYSAKEFQRTQLVSNITKESYRNMMNGAKQLGMDAALINSTNLHVFFAQLEQSDTNWIDEINKLIES